MVKKASTTAKDSLAIKTKDTTQMAKTTKTAKTTEMVKTAKMTEVVKTAKTKKDAKTTETAKAGKTGTIKPQDHKNWLYVCEAHESNSDEEEERSDTDEDDKEKDDDKEHCDNVKPCICKKSADEHPEHDGDVVTKKGCELGVEWII